jgi:hypothetical protein
MHIDSAFPSKYLKAGELGDSAPVVTIERVAFEAVGQTREMKPVAYFVGKSKGLVLNKTNATKIAQLLGSKDTDDWHGCQIRIYATETEMQGETVECIRVKAANGAVAPKPKPQADPVPVLDDSDIPFAWVMPLVLPALGLLSLATLA